MNYRHIYHAGNFADVLKHAVLARAIAYMARKAAPFRVIDTHAGSGRYLLTASEAAATGEWKQGIARLIGQDAIPLPPGLAGFLDPYLKAVLAENPTAQLERYPGSPRIALSLMRSTDRLIANELHPEARAQLKVAIGRDPRAKLMALDGFVALKALLPPKERRGIVLIDPPFEAPGELERVAEGLRQGLERFATGVFIAWYPIKDIKPINRFVANLASAPIRLLRAEILLARPERGESLNGCGLIIANPPYTLEGELARFLPQLHRRLADADAGGHRLVWIGNGAFQRNHHSDQKGRVRTSR
jgi:23S rRNA (adenine2030-N6)-methyltransferase